MHSRLRAFHEQGVHLLCRDLVTAGQDHHVLSYLNRSSTVEYFKPLKGSIFREGRRLQDQTGSLSKWLKLLHHVPEVD